MARKVHERYLWGFGAPLVVSRRVIKREICTVPSLYIPSAHTCHDSSVHYARFMTSECVEVRGRERYCHQENTLRLHPLTSEAFRIQAEVACSLSKSTRVQNPRRNSLHHALNSKCQ